MNIQSSDGSVPKLHNFEIQIETLDRNDLERLHEQIRARLNTEQELMDFTHKHLLNEQVDAISAQTEVHAQKYTLDKQMYNPMHNIEYFKVLFEKENCSGDELKAYCQYHNLFRDIKSIPFTDLYQPGIIIGCTPNPICREISAMLSNIKRPRYLGAMIMFEIVKRNINHALKSEKFLNVLQQKFLEFAYDMTQHTDIPKEHADYFYDRYKSLLDLKF